MSWLTRNYSYGDYSYGARDVAAIRTNRGANSQGRRPSSGRDVYRFEVRPFTDEQIALVQSFADHAAIAIENARLFDDVRAKTRDLSGALQQQTATADALSQSLADLDLRGARPKLASLGQLTTGIL
jgi:GAF domain-containing protein